MGKKCCNYPWITLFYSGEEKKIIFVYLFFFSKIYKKEKRECQELRVPRNLIHPGESLWEWLTTGIQDELSSESDRVKVMLFLHSADSFLIFFVIFLLDENFSTDENFKDKHYSRQLRIAQQRTRECITRSAIAIPQWHRYVQRWRAFSKRCLLTDVLSEPPTDSPLYVPFLPRWSFKFAVT